MTSHGVGPTLRLKERAGILETEMGQYTGGLFSWLHKSGPVGGTVASGSWASSSQFPMGGQGGDGKEDLRNRAEFCLILPFLGCGMDGRARWALRGREECSLCSQREI